jgi:enoyl-CoA hydratase/carnithine racemase
MSLQEFIPQPKFEDYKEQFKDHFILERRDDGVLKCQVHTLGGSWQLSVENHRAFGQVFRTIASDSENEVMILTGTGNTWLPGVDPEGFVLEKEQSKYWSYEYAYHDGRVNLQTLVNEIAFPTIGAINGPGGHMELCMMCDITICTEDTVIIDPHYNMGSVPGDGVHSAFIEVLGIKRAAHAMLMGTPIDAKQALEWGMVNEVVPREKLMDRAYEIADHIMKQNRYVRRMTTQVLRRTWKRRLLEDLDSAFSHQMYAHVCSGKAYHTDDHIAKQTAAAFKNVDRTKDMQKK